MLQWIILNCLMLNSLPVKYNVAIAMLVTDEHDNKIIDLHM